MPILNARSFVDKQGRSIDAEVVSVKGAMVTIKKNDNQQDYTLQISRFSEGDQEYIRKWNEDRLREGFTPTADSRFEVFVGFKSEDDLDEMGDFDDRIQRLHPNVRLVNDELYDSYNEVSGILILVGESVFSSSEMKILSSQRISLKHTPLRGESKWNGRSVVNQYDEDNSAKYGYKYKGYILMLKNKDGQIIYRKASRNSWERKSYNHLARLGEGGVYDRNLDNRISMPMN